MQAIMRAIGSLNESGYRTHLECGKVIRLRWDHGNAKWETEADTMAGLAARVLGWVEAKEKGTDDEAKWATKGWSS